MAREILQPTPVEVKFNELADAVAEGTCYATTREEIQTNPDYQKIVNLGVEVLPHVLKASEVSYFPGFMILQDITGENPVPKHQMGDKVAMLSRWKTRLQELYPPP